jgi:hypothetical protein
VVNELFVETSSRYPFTPLVRFQVAIKLVLVGGGGETASGSDESAFLFEG